MTLWHTLWNWYCEPKPFERRDAGRLYRCLGVRLFKRYLPTSGDLVTRWRRKRRIPVYNANTAADLLRYESVTRSYEARHIVGAVSMLLLTWWSITVISKGDWFVLIAANILINGYPIMVQRYNRVRLQSIVERLRAQS